MTKILTRCVDTGSTKVLLYTPPHTSLKRQLQLAGTRQVGAMTATVTLSSIPLTGHSKFTHLPNSAPAAECGCEDSAKDLAAGQQPGDAGRAAVGQAPAPSRHTPAAHVPQVPHLNIVMLVHGTRGDVQPFIALGLGLRRYGHRVRIAAAAMFRDFVTSFEGLEFYPLGGDPKGLSSYLVRHRGVWSLPDMLNLSEFVQRMREVCFSTFAACTEPDPGDPAGTAFRADAIIAIPFCFGSMDCAEKLGIPLHIVATFPWGPTSVLPSILSPFSVVSASTASAAVNRATHTWAAFLLSFLLRDVNEFRQQVLGLQPFSTTNPRGILPHCHQVPLTYCWSEALLPRPADWPSNAQLSGYFFLEQSALSAYQPPLELVSFLRRGEPPVYVGFGSLVVDDPQGLTRMVLKAAKQAGVRLLIHKGWGGLGDGMDKEEAGPEVFLLDTEVPHDWLFPRCSAVVHHGGAGTTAAGLRAGLPTTIVPIFLDQHLWGEAVRRCGAGPEPISVDTLSSGKLAAALQFMRRPEVQAAALAVAQSLSKEDGVAAAVDQFHQHLPLSKLAAAERVEWDLAQPTSQGLLAFVGWGLVYLYRQTVLKVIEARNWYRRRYPVAAAST